MPTPSRAVVEGMEAWLREHRNAARTLPVCAPLMAIVCALHEENHYLPTRERLAEAVEQCRLAADPSRAAAIRKGNAVPTSVHSVDAAVSTAAGLGDIELVTRTEDGAVSARKSIRSHRHAVPSKQLLGVWRRVSKRAQDTEERQSATS